MSEPVWKRPVWITAIVGLVSTVLMVPGIVGDLLAKKQDIEIAKQKTEELHFANLESKQTQAFSVVQQTLAQQGEERAFILRYLAATLDDPDVKTWASQEVLRLDHLARLQQDLDQTRRQLAAKQEEAAGSAENAKQLNEEMNGLLTERRSKDAEASQLRPHAGFRLASSETGQASYYGDRFHGRLTASGETFDKTKLTAAHRTLPFGTVVSVTNLSNSKSVKVRINDRGPFVRGRIIDLSQAAAEQLGFLEEGVANVRVEVIE